MKRNGAKRLLAGGMAAVMLMACAAGCGNGSSSSSSTAAGKTASGKVDTSKEVKLKMYL